MSGIDGQHERGIQTLSNELFHRALATAIFVVLTSGCASLASTDAIAPPAAPTAQSTAAAGGNRPTGEPTRGAKTDPGLVSTPAADEGPGIAVTPAAPPASVPNLPRPIENVPPLPKPSVTAAASSADEWADWKGNGYAFRYPRACKVLVQQDQSISVGAGIELSAADPGGLDFFAYVNQLLESRSKAGTWKIESQQVGQVGVNQAVRVEYRFGGTNRYGTAIFVPGNEKVYTWQLTPGTSTCGEAAAFEQTVSSMRFYESTKNAATTAMPVASISVTAPFIGVTGIITLTVVRGGTQVGIAVADFGPSTAHAARILAGRCSAPGGAVADLPTLNSESTGKATSSAFLNIGFSAVTDGNHIVVAYFGPDAENSRVIACADIPRRDAAAIDQFYPAS